MLDFVARIENVSILEAAERIEHICRIRHDRAVMQRQEATQNGSVRDPPNEPLRPLPFRLMLDASHPYLAERQISPKIAAMFGLGYCGHGTMKGRICMPIHDERGVLVAYTGRWASDELPEGVPKYDLPHKFPKRRVLLICTVSPAPSIWCSSKGIGRSSVFTPSTYRPSPSWGARSPLNKRRFL